jgi:hypothetical protein
MLLSLKKLLPIWFKFPFWYLFKSPQRQFGMGSFLRDTVGIFRYIKVNIFPQPNLKPISICIAIKDRDYELQNYVLQSLKKIDNPSLLELCIFDCGSHNAAILESSIHGSFNGKLKFKSVQMKFERAYALNQAAAMAENEILFFTDVDFEIPKAIVQLANNYTFNKYMWFPIVFYLYKGKDRCIKKENGEWMVWGGKGVFACYKNTFEALGKLNEQFKTWGGEDEEFWLRCHEAKKIIIRNKEKQLIHQWHPSSNEKYIKLAQEA